MSNDLTNKNSSVKLNNDVTIPRVGLGVFQVEAGKETEQVVHWGLEAGYRHIDTAKAYGNEESVGRAVSDSGLPREQIFITTKLWNADTRAGKAREACENSLRRLGTDYIDLYLIHWPTEGYERAWDEMQKLYHEQKIRAIGVSNFNIHHLETLKRSGALTPAANQIECHPLNNQEELRQYCADNNIAVEAWSPLGGTGGNLLQNEDINKIAAKYGKSPAQIVLRWDLQSGMITLPKSVNQARIAANIDLFDFELSADDMAFINSLNQNKRVGPDPDNFSF
jgi:diketogulonate reductase-like aldo/keto reductase